MSLYIKKHFYDKLPDDGGDAGGDGTPATPPAEPATPPADEAGGDHLDDLGYEKVSNEPGKEDKKPGEKKETPPAEDEKPKGPVAGYGLEDPPAEPPATPPATPPPGEKIELGYELEIKDLPAEEAKKIQEFAKAHKLPKEAAQALVQMKTNEAKFNADVQAEIVKQNAKAQADKKAGWQRELKGDKEFGGDNFAKSLVNVEKVMTDFFPNMKKDLTASGAMLPPNAMRDMAKLAKHLYGTEKLIQGGGGTPKPVVEDESDDPTDFYKS